MQSRAAWGNITYDSFTNYRPSFHAGWILGVVLQLLNGSAPVSSEVICPEPANYVSKRCTFIEVNYVSGS